MAKLIAIDAFYDVAGHPEFGRVKLTHVRENTGTVANRDSAWVVMLSDLIGPFNVPCPYCGDLKRVQPGDGMHIDLAEHLDRHRAVGDTAFESEIDEAEVDELKRRLKAVIDESDIQSSQLACAAVVIREARALGEIILKNEQLTEAEFGIMNLVAHVQLYDEMFPPVGENVSLDDVLPDPEATPG